MSLSPEAIDAMIAAGLSAEQMGAIIKAELLAARARESAADEERREKARAGNRERQARWRDRRNAHNADNGVTGRDERYPSPKDNNQTPTQPIPPVDPDGSTAPKGAGDAELPGLADPVEAGAAPAAQPSAETPRAKSEPRARRLTADFADSPEARAVCAEMGLTEAEADAALAEFCDYWLAEGGQKARKVDWPRTLRNRLREMGRRRQARPPDARPPGGSGGDQPPPNLFPGRSDQRGGFHNLNRRIREGLRDGTADRQPDFDLDGAAVIPLRHAYR
ncbi:hypothetical protein LRS73_17530 [Methylobacterium currus]|uniref:hypothetical protein n=1 Tax=Methylobacterium currus TaxID=2051553 RepID=UPI001E5930C4|nr:hypothetical protein [Methylobacterium currus]UHC14362.1 hypothetical protein LRS73_17530 [Methylobacterium currus]